MARRSKRRPRRESAAPALDGPAIVLVAPQLGENVGAAARAMLNCGLNDLRLVQPRDGWPNAKAAAAATGALAVVEQARVFPSIGAAVADVEHVYATTGRTRDLDKEVVEPAEAVMEMKRFRLRGERSAVLFGPERTGLDNDDVSLAEKVLHVPLNPGFSSLNLAQAVLLVGYEWWRASSKEVARSSISATSDDPRATSGELQNLFEHLEQELDASGFLRVTEKRAIMVRNLRNLLHRARLRQHEVRTLHGILSALTGRRKDGAPTRRPGHKQRPATGVLEEE